MTLGAHIIMAIELSQSELNELESAANAFGSGFQNLGRGDEHFSMKSLTLSATFSLDGLDNGRQYIYNNHTQASLAVRNDDLTVMLNTENGQAMRLTFRDAFKEPGWQDIQVVVDESKSSLEIWVNGEVLHSSSSDGIMIEDASYWDVTAGGTLWGSNLQGQIADVTVLDHAVTIDPDDSIADRMLKLNGEDPGEDTSGPVIDTPDSGDNNTPDTGDDNSEAVVTGTSSGEVTEDVDLTTGGKLNAADPDAGESGFQADTENGQYGDFSINENGNWTYTLTDSDELDWLDSGETISETFTVRTIDGTTSDVTVDINGQDEPVEEPTTPPANNNNASDLEILQSAANAFGSGFQNLGRGDEHFSMKSLTLSATFSLDGLDNGRQYIYNNHTQASLAVRNDDLTVMLNTENGQAMRLTFRDAFKEPGWQDIQVVVDESKSSLEIWVNGEVLHSSSSDGIMIEDASYWDVTAGGTLWGSNLQGQIADVTVLDHAVTIDPDDSIADRMLKLNGEDPGEDTSGPVIDTPDSGDNNTPDTGDDNSEAVVTGTSSGEVTEDVDLTTGGKLNAADPDAGESGFQADTENGQYGDFSINENGNWTYTLTDSDELDWLDSGETISETFTVRTIDGTTSDVTVDINGRNEPSAPGTGAGGGTGGNTGGGGSTPTLGVIEVSSISGLVQALSGNVAGYTIELAPGNYGTLNLNGYNFSSPVTITSANPGNPAHFESVTVNNSSNMTFDSLEISSYDGVSASWGEYMFTINGSSDIVLSDNVFGNNVNGLLNQGIIGLKVATSEDITVEGNEFMNLHTGAHFRDSSGIDVLGNAFHDLRTDGTTFTGVQDIQIQGNSFRDFYHLEGDHSDYVQFYTTSGLQSNANIVISDNLMVQGDGVDAQAIFMTSSNSTTTNVTIDNNVIFQSGYHGISVYGTNSLDITNNTVISPEDSPNGNIVWIQVKDGSNVSIDNNITNSILTESSSVSQSGNIIVDDNSYGRYFQNDLNIRSVDAEDFELLSNVNAGADVSDLLGDILGGTLSAFSSTVASIDDNEPTGGDDYIEGTSSSDLLFGFDGDDELFGFGGADIIVGGDGADTLSGGEGRDTFAYTETGDSGIGNGNRDVIMDFDATNGDTLSFEGFATDNFAYSFDDRTDVLSVDLDGDFTIDMEIQLIGVSASDLDGSDFMT